MTNPQKYMNTLVKIDATAQSIDTKPVVSVVIPSYYYVQHIRQCLEPLLSQITEVPFEIIIVDSSADGTDRIVSKEFPEVRIFHFNERKFVGEARNAGIDKAKGKFILFLDQDCIVPSDWIDRMYRVFQRTQADGVGGSLENGTPLSISGTAGYYLEFFRFLPKRSSSNESRPITNLFLVGGNCGFKKEVFNNIRYYDNYDKTKIGEDFYFSWQLSRQGKKLVYEPSISVKHFNKTGFLTLFRYQYKIGKSACAYRYHVSSKIMPLLIKYPYLSLFLPIIIIPWIGLCVLKGLGILEFIKFAAMLPLLVIGNYVWSVGFLRQLKNIIKNKF